MEFDVKLPFIPRKSVSNKQVNVKCFPMAKRRVTKILHSDRHSLEAKLKID